MSLTSRETETSNSGSYSRNPDPSRLARRYAQVINDQTKEVSVGLGTNRNFFSSLGMTEQDVELADNGKWYLAGHAPRETKELTRNSNIEIPKDGSFLLTNKTRLTEELAPKYTVGPSGDFQELEEAVRVLCNMKQHSKGYLK